MKKFLYVMSAIFGALTIIFFVSSLNHLDRDTARFLGTSTTINIQGTIFCAACAVICALKSPAKPGIGTWSLSRANAIGVERTAKFRLLALKICTIGFHL